MRETTTDILKNISSLAANNDNRSTYLRLISYIDATALDVSDNEESISSFTASIMAATSEDYLPNVASICVPPLYVESVGLALGNDSPVAICTVCGGFPMAQTYPEVKLFECAMALENSADEIDVVINVGDLLHGDGEEALSELRLYREECGDDVILKVIIESGVLKSEELIRKATRIAIEADSDFVKTSTGKTEVGATYEAVAAICEEIKLHYETTGEIVGVKVSGGVREPEDALAYYAIISGILGEKWLTPNYFRIGASSLLTKLLEKVKN